MIVGIGTDIVKVERLASSVARFGTRFVKKILTVEEMAHCDRGAGSIACLARRFAAKEAFAKALGTGMSQGVWFTDIQVAHSPSGRPELLFSGETQKKVARLGPLNIHLSISDEKEFAVAFVILETHP
ncbi:MAG: holo-ACP synthase [Magnetococcales bacterium]|nr:holo-ACP synthase [Magnetococcales bacterium]MBF0151307.1 holo-ACP synthase [Magnetococcales bacterium]MBF0173379.1 holo-ACP synthase [Magnetococcales bacterium]MBF0348658.1 holo-ACP synthase [Magnetococcales bacterium]